MSRIKIATAAYPPAFLPDWATYESRITAWVEEAAGQGAQLLVFPEYAALELASLAGVEVSSDRDGALRAASDRMPEACALHARLAQEHGVYILMGSGPVDVDGVYVNRAHFVAPSGAIDHQDKQIMTRFEREDWGIAGGGPLKLFDTALGKISVLICYDSEFPFLGRALAEAELLLIPSVTEALAGHTRVRIGARARALESQCVTIMSSLINGHPDLYGIEEGTGRGGVFGPPDTGFPEDGIIASGGLNHAGWTYATIDRAAIAHVRADGVVLNRRHWDEQVPRDGAITNVALR